MSLGESVIVVSPCASAAAIPSMKVSMQSFIWRLIVVDVVQYEIFVDVLHDIPKECH